jgi:PAS domain S-box-containing protein
MKHPRPGPLSRGFRPDVSAVLPLMILIVMNMSGSTLKEALKNCADAFFSLNPGLLLWGQILALNALIFAYLLPVFRARKACIAAGAAAPSCADEAMKRLNGMHHAVILVSTLVFVAFRLLQFIVSADLSDHGADGPFMHVTVYLVEAGISGFFVGVILALQFDNSLYEARRCIVALDPATPLAPFSFFKKVFLALVAIMLFMTAQSISAFSSFLELGMKGALPAGGAPGAAAWGPEILLRTWKDEGIGNAFKVFGLRFGILFACTTQLLRLLKSLIKHPVRTVQERLTALNSPDPGASRSIEVVQEDEFAPIFREINSLIERQRGQIKLSGERLEGIVSNAADPIVAFDGKGAIRLFNPAAESAFGYASREALGMDVSALIPGDIERARCGESVRLPWRRRDGSTILLESRVSCAPGKGSIGEDGGEAWTVLILRDVGAQAELEKTLVLARTEAENASRMKSEFLANMSHELRTPLNAILGFTQLLSDDRNLTERQKDRIGTISRSGEHLLALINDILDISKIEAGKMELRESAFDLPRFLSDMAEMFELRCKKKGLTLYADGTQDLPRWVEGDIGKLRQVLVNLLGNAVKFTEDGGVGVLAGRDGDRVRFEVRDTGRGIPSGELEGIMQPFVQASTTDHEGGTGLGLAISKRYVAMMGGELKVESELGKGSVFSFSLPLREGAAPPAREEEPLGSFRIKGGAEARALVVDDQGQNRLVLKEMLEGIGFAVVEASNGAEALLRARENPPAIVFMDIKMPVMDGYAAVAELKRDPLTGSIVVFALTASAFTQDEERIASSGFDGYLAKPFKRSALHRLIREKGGLELEAAEARADGDAEGGSEPDAADFAEAAAALGSQGSARLRSAAQINDFAALRAEAEARELPRAFRAALSSAADSYDEDAVSDLLARLSAAAGKGGNA